MHKAFSATLETVFASFPDTIAIAVSGGADSFALLHLAKEWADAHGVKIIALTVDHQLRPESLTEAQTVQRWCIDHGIDHHILPWEGDKPRTALQAKARNARRRLLCAAAQHYGAKAVLLGHQADDQTETLLMRLQRGTGLDGLKAMQPRTIDKTTRLPLIRPLLSQRRQALRAYCMAHQLPFIDDPSNDNPVYERVQLRQLLQQWPSLADGVAKATPRLARANDTLKQLADEWVQRHRVILKDTSLWLPPLNDLLPEIRLRVLQRCCPDASLPSLEKISTEITQPDFSGKTSATYWIRPKVMDKQPGFLIQKAPQRRK